MLSDETIRRGTIILTEGRSGSNWLGSLTNSTKVLGQSEEWIDFRHSNIEAGSVCLEQYFLHILNKASTENGYFCLKMFPRHLFNIEEAYNCDLISELKKRFDINLIFLQRRNRVAQAISFVRAYQTGSWRSTTTEKKEARYNFDDICRAYFFIQRSYDFWKTYLDLKSFEAETFFYEDMLDDYSPYIEKMQNHACIKNIDLKKQVKSQLSIQRDIISDEWHSRFYEDLKSNNILTGSLPRIPPVTGSNIINFLRQKPTKPKPFVL